MDITNILAILSPIVAVACGVIAMRRGQKTDDTSSGREMGALISEVAYVKATVDNISRKLDSNDERFTKLAERVSAVEQSAASAHHRLDTLRHEEVKIV